MAVPKRKTTPSRKKLRTSKKKLLHYNTYTSCSKCYPESDYNSISVMNANEHILRPHYICLSCIKSK